MPMTGPVKTRKNLRNINEKMRRCTRYFCVHVTGYGRARQTLRITCQLPCVRGGESGDARTENWAVRCEANATERRAAANMNF